MLYYFIFAGIQQDKFYGYRTRKRFIFGDGEY